MFRSVPEAGLFRRAWIVSARVDHGLADTCVSPDDMRGFMYKRRPRFYGKYHQVEDVHTDRSLLERKKLCRCPKMKSFTK